MRLDVATDISREIVKARDKHGLSIESYDNGMRLAVLTEEVGEVARAMCNLHLAESARDAASKSGTTADLETARRNVEAARAHIYTELIQVAACAARWLETRG